MTGRWLVTGAGGQVGQAVMQALPQSVGMGRDGVDITDPAALEVCLATLQPALVVNCAAFTDVDGAEGKPDQAWAANAEGPAVLARACARHDIPLIHLSTDFVFDGRGTRAYREDDPVGPVSVYGASKLAGELAVAALCRRHIILRVSWVFGQPEKGFLPAIVRRARSGGPVRVVDDALSCPTPAAAVAAAIGRIGDVLVAGGRDLAGEPAYGVFHFCGSAVLRRPQWARQALDSVGLNTCPVDSVPVGDWPQAARRPSFSVMDCSRLRTCYGIEQPDWIGAVGVAFGTGPSE